MQKIGILDVSKVYHSMFQDLSSFETPSQSVILYHRFDKFVFILDPRKKKREKEIEKAMHYWEWKYFSFKQQRIFHG